MTVHATFKRGSGCHRVYARCSHVDGSFTCNLPRSSCIRPQHPGCDTVRPHHRISSQQCLTVAGAAQYHVPATKHESYYHQGLAASIVTQLMPISSGTQLLQVSTVEGSTPQSLMTAQKFALLEAAAENSGSHQTTQSRQLTVHCKKHPLPP